MLSFFFHIHFVTSSALIFFYYSRMYCILFFLSFCVLRASYNTTLIRNIQTDNDILSQYIHISFFVLFFVGTFPTTTLSLLISLKSAVFARSFAIVLKIFQMNIKLYHKDIQLEGKVEVFLCF